MTNLELVAICALAYMIEIYHQGLMENNITAKRSIVALHKILKEGTMECRRRTCSYNSDIKSIKTSLIKNNE